MSKSNLQIVISDSSVIPDWLPNEMKSNVVLSSDVHLKSKGTVYLEYIVNNYHSLPDYVLFVNSDPFKTCLLSREKFIDALINEPCILYDRSAWNQCLKCLGDGRPHHPGLEITEWFSRLFPGQAAPQVFDFIAGSQFLYSKERLLSNPKSFYETILQYTIKNELNDYILERLWNVIINGVQKQGAAPGNMI